MSFDMSYWVVLWSPHQNLFHVQTVQEMIEDNRVVFEYDRKGDYIVLDIVETHDEATHLTRKLIEIRNKRLESEEKHITIA